MSKLPQAKLSAAARKLADKIADTDDIAARMLRAEAASLDFTAHSLAARGERVKSLSAYRKLLRRYNRLSPDKPYEG
jgi:hypothetical protein